MSYNILLSENFKKEAKRLIKKYPSLKSELANLFAILEENPTLGTPLGKDVFKIRLAISSKNKGKSGGARILTFLKIDDSSLLAFSIYDKSEKSSLSEKEIKALIKDYL
jgi:hypothetical protein